jgi:rubrerythrin
MTETFENARKGLDEIRASEWEYRLVDLLAAHGAGEETLLAEYERLVADSSSPAVRYLAQLILDDERRHHRVLVEIANAVAWGWSGNSPQPAVPELSAGRAKDDGVAAATRALLAAERRDQSELKKLHKELRPVADTTLWGLLVDLMLLDTDKHIRILRFLSDHVHQ